MIYFDNAATTPMDDSSIKELIEKSASCFGNPSTRYSLGVASKRELTKARITIAGLMNCKPDDLFFTSGGTESNNIIIQSFIREYEGQKINIVTSSMEHDSVLKTLERLRSEDVTVTVLKPNSDGIISPKEVELSIRPETKLICIQYINNEIGTIQPIEEISKIARSHGIHFHVDAVQAVGHIRIDIRDLQIDSLSASAHKFFGPKGVGFLFSKKHDIALCYGGGQEKNVKSGTENVPAICSMSIALCYSLNNIDAKIEHINNMVSLLVNELTKIDGLLFNVIPKKYTSILNFRVNNVSNEALVNYLDINGVCVSTGSACSGNSFERSHVLSSLNLTNKQIDSSIRVSLSYKNTEDECRIFLSVLKRGITILLEEKHEYI